MRRQLGSSLIQIMVVLALSTGLVLPLFRLLEQVKMTEQTVRQLAVIDNHGRYVTLYLRRWFKQWRFKFQARITGAAAAPDFIKGDLQSDSTVLLVKPITTTDSNMPWTAIYVRSRPSGSYALYIQKQGHRARQLQDHVACMYACFWDAGGHCRQSVKRPVGLHIVFLLSAFGAGNKPVTTEFLPIKNFDGDNNMVTQKWPIDIEISHAD